MITKTNKTDIIHYIPHQGVIKTNIKLRILINASTKTSQNKMSFNENLYSGLVLLENLTGVLSFKF